MIRTLLLFSLSAAFCVADHYDPIIFGALQWRSVGPNRGGRSITSAGSAARPNEYYFGAVGGGLWKTTDGGSTWKPVTDGQIKSSSVGAVAVSESNPDVVYIGMGETELRGNIMQGDGVYKSTDAGKTWTHIGLTDTQAIARIRIDPSNPDVVYVAALGHPYGPNAERGVFRSRDGGKTWQKILYKNDRAGAVDLALDPHNARVIYAAIWDAYRTSWTLSSGGPLTGFYKSTDGGDHWTEITRNQGLPQGIVGKIGVAVSADSNRVYAMVEADDGGLFRSEDAGATWARISEDRRLRQRAFYYTRITADPKDKDTLYILNTGLYKSTDGGKTVKQLRPPHGDQHDLWIASNDPNRIINSNDGGANVSVNGGETWTGQAYPTAQLYHVAVTKDVPYHVCGAQQDNSTICVTSAPAGRGGGTTGSEYMGRPVYSPGGGESGYIAPDPKDPNILYAGSQGALLTRYERDTGHMRDVQVYPLFFSGMPSSALKERWQWTFPIVFNAVDPKILYTSSQHLWKTTNEGQSWEMISPDLTRHDPKTLGDSGGPITKDQNGPEIYATIFTIAPSPKDVNTIWTGSDDGLVYVTRDGGKNWKNVTPKGLPDFNRISIIDASPNKVGTAYLAAKNYQADDRKPYAYRTDDFGATWTKIVNGIPDDDFVHVVREDPKRPGLLFAGTEHGIYISFDNGSEWQSIRLNLPDTQVPDLLFEGDDLVIATHGRSMYVMDDISLLRELKTAPQTTHLFTPKPAARSLDRGATLDYFLPKAADEVKIEILDSSGKVVRSIIGSDDEEKKQRARREAAGDDGEGGGRGGAPLPARKAGGNRYTWDLRYPGATTFDGLIFWGASTDQGPLAVPGQYQVRLTAGGATESRPLRVVRDPREIKITQADLEEQFKLASAVRDKTSEANEMVIRIRDLKKQIDDRVKKAPTLNAPGERLTTRLSAVEEDVYQVRNRSNQDPLNFPIKINNQLGALLRIIETGDAKPTDQSYVVFKELSAQLDAIKARLDAILKNELVQFNTAASGAGQAVIK
ncbi:MAG TPA: hypothetical protein VNX18_02315 [Bryobacteraceae bacterium]|nr:hypothetical protein [Bryobacteraceae bacterium]